MLLKTLVVAYGVLLAFVDAKHNKGIQIKNKGGDRLWVEMTDEQGFYLPSGQQASIIVEDKWTGRIRTYPEDCGKTACDLPYTEAVFKFYGEGTADGYYVSTINGFNKPIKIQPSSIEHVCKPAQCQANINHHCPETHRSTNSEGTVIACKSVPDLFQKMCPHAIATEADIPSNIFSCRSNIYMVLIG